MGNRAYINLNILECKFKITYPQTIFEININLNILECKY